MPSHLSSYKGVRGDNPYEIGQVRVSLLNFCNNALQRQQSESRVPGATSNNRHFPRPPVAADSVLSLHELESIQREISKHSKTSIPRAQPQTGLGTTGSILPQKAANGNLP